MLGLSAHSGRDVAGSAGDSARILRPHATGRSSISGVRRTRRTVLAVIALTAVNIVIVLLAGKGALHYMDSPAFCGQACHMPMHPQFTAWQAAPHSEVTCTACHVGEGAKALVRAKLAGTRQLYHVLTNQVPKPIPGVADMRPALETCGNCHWPGRDSGDVITVKREYADDDTNSETATILQMFVGGPGRPTSSGRAIHWHADPDVRIEFVSTDHERQTIPYVRLVGKDGKVKEYKAEGATDEEIAKGERRVDGLHRLSQRAGASDRADRRAGRRRRDRERQHQPGSAVRSPRECPAGQVGLLDPGAGAGRNREGSARLLYRQGAASTTRRSHGRLGR